MQVILVTKMGLLKEMGGFKIALRDEEVIWSDQSGSDLNCLVNILPTLAH